MYVYMCVYICVCIRMNIDIPVYFFLWAHTTKPVRSPRLAAAKKETKMVSQKETSNTCVWVVGPCLQVYVCAEFSSGLIVKG